jgi:hypothetical protein
LLEGGYIGLWTPAGWSQLTADGNPHHSASPRHVGNRWHGRLTERQDRRRSTPHEPARPAVPIDGETGLPIAGGVWLDDVAGTP